MKILERVPTLEVAAFLTGVMIYLSGTCAHAMTIVEKPQAKDGYAFETSLSIGGPDAPDESYFYERFGSVEVAADAEGRVYVLDNGNIRIQVFDADGNWLRSLGSEGEGPGEFQMMGQFAVNGAGDVAVLDMGSGRVSVLDTEGALLFDLPGNFGVEGLALLDDRTVLLSYGKVGPAKVEAYGPDGERRWQAGDRTDPDGGPVVNIQLDRQTIAPRMVALADGRSVRAPLGEYRFELFGAEGAVGGAFSRPFDRQKISAEELAPPASDDEEGGEQVMIMIRQDAGGAGGGGGGGDHGGERSWSTEGGDGGEMTFTMDDMSRFMPEFHPDTRGLLAFPDGRVWVVTAEDGRKGTVTDEWNAEGEWVRRFWIPGDWDRVSVGRDGNLYGVTHDDDDYPTVHRIEVRTS